MAAFFSVERDRENAEDYISEMPDDILLTFESHLGIKDAVKTSILSKKWRNLWDRRTHLDFNHVIVLPETDTDVEKIYHVTAGQKSKYVNWVNQVVDLHCSQFVDTFRVYFHFDSNDAHHIHKWVKFALSKQVTNLELNLVFYYYDAVCTIGLDILKPSVLDSGISYLKNLHLSNINVNGEFLEYLLSYCCLLERVYIRGSRTLVKWKVAGLSCKLKQLIIRYCHNLEELEIDAVNLIHLECNGLKNNANVVFKSVPMLVEAIFCRACLQPSASVLQHFSHPVWAQISKLSLDLPGGEIPTGVLPSFCNLKQLNMIIDAGKRFDLVGITHFLNACPMLCEFNLKIRWFRRIMEEEATELKQVNLDSEDVARYNRAVEAGFGWDYFYSMGDTKITKHPNLKLLKVVGFKGSNFDVGFILFLAFLASNLETVVCDCNSGILPYWKFPGDIIEASRSRADKLEKLISPKISLVIM